MFNKLIQNLAVSPSTINQFSFYSRRLKREKSIRGIALGLMILTMFVQIFASAVPPEKSFAASNNDIISGGVKTKAELVNKCKNNAQIRAIFARFDVTCEHIASSTTTETSIKASAYNYWSIGRTPLSSNGLNSDDWGEVKLSAGGTTVYQRPLKAWGANVTYPAFNIKANGKNYWVLKDCGNLVTIGPYSRTPQLEVKKQLMTPASVKPGDTVKFRISYRNPVPESVAIDFRLRDLLSQHLELKGMDGRNDFIGDDPVTNLKGLGGSDTFREVNLVATVKSGTPHGTEICNIARVSADVVGVKDSNKVCVTVVNPPQTPTPTPAPAPTPTPTPTPTPPQETPMCPIPGKTNLPANSPDCKVDAPNGLCVVSTGFLENSNKDFKVKTEATISPNNKVTKYTYYLDGNPTPAKTIETNSLTDEQTFSGLVAGNHNVKVTVTIANSANETVNKDCAAEVTVAEDPRLALTKNVTRNGENIDGKTVKSGDVLTFNLVTKNITNTTYEKYRGEDYFGDVLDYADFVDKTQLEKQGMVLGEDKVLRWETAAIAGNKEEVKQITVKVKEVTPSTNRPNDVSSDYDCIISNKYGNQVTMSVSCPLIKSIEKLPDTGPGTTIAIAFGVTVISGYFFSRASLLAKESSIIKRLYQYTGQGV